MRLKKTRVILAKDWAVTEEKLKKTGAWREGLLQVAAGQGFLSGWHQALDVCVDKEAVQGGAKRHQRHLR